MENYKSICDKCYRKTWYDAEQQCHCTYPKKKICKTCGHIEELDTMERCTGTLKLIDNSELNTRFDSFYNSGQRVEVSFRDSNGKEYKRKRGYIGKTTGWKPSYMLLLRSNSTGSSYLMGNNDTVLRAL